MTQTRARIVAISLLVLAGCQSPGSFSGLFGGKDTSATGGRSVAVGNDESKADQHPLFSWNRKPKAIAQGAGGQQSGNGSSLTPDPIAQELQKAEQAQNDGRMTAAQSGYQKVLQLQPDNVDAHQGLAVLLDQQGAFREAERHYLQALQVAPRNPDILSNLGYSYSMQERFSEAEQALQAALEIEPRHRTALFNLGAVYAKQGRYEQALAVFREGGSEQQAQAALAQFNTRRPGEAAPGSQTASNSSSPTPPMPLEQMTPETRKLWESIQTERKAQEQRQAVIRNKQGQGSRISAPNPGHREAGRFQPAPPGAMTAEQRRQRAKEFLTAGRPNPSEFNQLFTDIDHNAAREQARIDYSQAPAASGTLPPNSLAARGAQPPAESNWMLNPNAAAQGDAGSWGSVPQQSPGSFGPPPSRQFAENQGPQEWNPITMAEGTGGAGTSTQTVSASRPITAPPTRPRITAAHSGHGNASSSPSPATGSWNGGLVSQPDQQPSGNLPPWTPGLQQSSGSPSPAPWQGNSLPIPAGGGQDDFVTIPGQGTGVSGTGRPQTSASPPPHSPIQQVSGIHQAHFTQTGPQGISAPAPRNAWEQARLEAAQMGLNAGPGSMFPVTHAGGAENASQPPQGATPTYPGANGWGTQPSPGFRQGPQHQDMSRASIPAAGVPSAQGISYGDAGTVDAGTVDAARARLMQSAATETGRRQFDYQLQTTRQTQIPSQAEQQRAANLWPSSAGGGATGPQRLPVHTLPADGGFPGQP